MQYSRRRRIAKVKRKANHMLCKLEERRANEDSESGVVDTFWNGKIRLESAVVSLHAGTHAKPGWVAALEFLQEVILELKDTRIDMRV